jgi:hypothetical protein
MQQRIVPAQPANHLSQPRHQAESAVRSELASVARSLSCAVIEWG